MKRTFLLTLYISVTCLLVRLAFDPTLFKTQMAFDHFYAAVEHASSSSQLDAIVVERGLTDFWGRDVLLVKQKGLETVQFVVVPNDFYSAHFRDLAQSKISIKNVCMDCTPGIEIVMVLCGVGLLLLLMKQNKPTLIP